MSQRRPAHLQRSVEDDDLLSEDDVDVLEQVDRLYAAIRERSPIIKERSPVIRERSPHRRSETGTGVTYAAFDLETNGTAKTSDILQVTLILKYLLQKIIDVLQTFLMFNIVSKTRNAELLNNYPRSF